MEMRSTSSNSRSDHEWDIFDREPKKQNKLPKEGEEGSFTVTGPGSNTTVETQH